MSDPIYSLYDGNYPNDSEIVLLYVREVPYPIAGFWHVKSQRFYFLHCEVFDSHSVTHWQRFQSPYPPANNLGNVKHGHNPTLCHHIPRGHQDVGEEPQQESHGAVQETSGELRKQFLPAEAGGMWPTINVTHQGYDEKGHPKPKPSTHRGSV